MKVHRGSSLHGTKLFVTVLYVKYRRFRRELPLTVIVVIAGCHTLSGHGPLTTRGSFINLVHEPYQVFQAGMNMLYSCIERQRTRPNVLCGSKYLFISYLNLFISLTILQNQRFIKTHKSFYVATKRFLFVHPRFCCIYWFNFTEQSPHHSVSMNSVAAELFFASHSLFKKTISCVRSQNKTSKKYSIYQSWNIEAFNGYV